MPGVVQFSSPNVVEYVPSTPQPLADGNVRVQTWYSGISAGTELTAYRGSNPYLSKTWDPVSRLFTEGDPTFGYPVSGWGYSEVGQVVEVSGSPEELRGVRAGDVVHGIWGHRSEAVLPAGAVAGRVLPAGVDPVLGVFARVGAIALNSLLAADVRLGDRVAVFGQGVIGLLATRLASLSGCEVVAVDATAPRLDVARAMGADHVVLADAPGGAGAALRALTGGAGVDAAIELSGNDRALHEATRCVGVDGTVVAAGFYQGGAAHLLLGEEFHHNRVRIVASQISGTPPSLGLRWNQPRLVEVVMGLVVSGKAEAQRLVTDIVDVEDVAAAFERLDRGDPECLQVVLRFEGAPQR